MSIIIKANSQVTEDENAQLDAVCDLAYAGDETDLTWTDEQDWRVWVQVDGQILSCLTIVERDAVVGGVPVRLGGIGGVATLPSQQRKGYAGQVLSAGFCIGKHSRAFQDELDSQIAPGDQRRVFLLQQAYLIAIDEQLLALQLDAARESPVGAVVLEKMRVDGWINQVVESH